MRHAGHALNKPGILVHALWRDTLVMWLYPLQADLMMAWIRFS